VKIVKELMEIWLNEVCDNHISGNLWGLNKCYIMRNVYPQWVLTVADYVTFSVLR